MTTTTIDPRFCGPPNSGNGGYVCGLLAKALSGAAEVTLKKPPPLSKPLTITSANGIVQLTDEDEVVGVARAGSVEFEAPAAPSFEEAGSAAKNYICLVEGHPFPTCFVCGPDREEGEALCIYPGKVNSDDMVAAPWTPDGSLADAHGDVRDEFVWAALDCPGAFAIMGDTHKMIVLGRMSADIRTRVKAGENCVVIGWKKGSDGRKHFSGTAVYNSSGELCAVGNAVWIDIGGKM